jgi:hypothetical protein
MSLRQPPDGRYQVGDKVRYAGMEGEVRAVYDENVYPVLCRFEHEAAEFTHGGLYLVNHKAPLLEFVSRPKKKTRVVKMAPALYRVINFGGMGITNHVFQDETTAIHFLVGSVMHATFIRLLWDRAVEVEVSE